MKILALAFSLLLCLGSSVCSAAYYTLKMVKPTENYSLKYDDENIYASFAMAKKDPDRLFISLYNKTDEVITVKWSEVSLIFAGKAHMVLPGSQISTGLNAYSSIKDVSIPPHTAFEDSLFAEGNISYYKEPAVIRGSFGRYRGWGGYWGGWVGFDDFFSTGGREGWQTKPFFPAAKTEADAAELVGDDFGIFLSFNVKGQDATQRIDFTIDKVSHKKSPGSLGLMVADAKELAIMKKDAAIQTGVLVMDLAKKSAAKDAGILPDDNIIKIDSQVIENIEDFVVILNQKNAGEEIKLTYLRDGKTFTATAKLKKI